MVPDLPVLGSIDEIRSALRDPGVCVLIAPPGTGKTTGVPPLLVDEPWLDGARILMLEPRRLAARVTAMRMTQNQGGDVGGLFGYSVRGESHVSEATRVEVITEGLFLRRIQSDPSLNGIGLVILDEFHERSVDSDLALAMLDDVRSSIRPDLRILVMSATMDPGPIAEMLGAPVITANATIYPVETRYRPGSAHSALEERVAEVVVESIGADSGDILVFLPGRPEINRTRRALDQRLRIGDVTSTVEERNSGLEVVELHGSLSPAQQQLAIDPLPDGRRKVILSTSLAETSITIPGVRVVVDSGRRRTSVFDPRRGIPGLVTVAASRASAEQRRGRAGRTGPGVAYRLWAQGDDRHRPVADPPELSVADLSPLLLQVLAWGVEQPDELRWLDSPPEQAVANARELLGALGAVDSNGRLTEQGRRFASVGYHPRLAAMAIESVRLGTPELGAELCALVETSRSGEIDIVERIDSLAAERGRLDGDLAMSLRQWRRTIATIEQSAQLALRGSEAARGDNDGGVIGRIVIAGYPDRVARRRHAARATSGRGLVAFQLRSGGEVTVPASHPLKSAEWVVAIDLDAESKRLHIGVEVSAELVMEHLSDRIVQAEVVEWNDRTSRINARHTERLGSIVLTARQIAKPDPELVASALRDAIETRGPLIFGRLGEAAELRARVAMLRSANTCDYANDDEEPDDPSWPDFSDEGLRRDLLRWLGHRCDHLRTAADFNTLDIVAVLREQLGWEQSKLLDQMLPTNWELMSGRTVRLRYGQVDGEPISVLASVRIRDALGTDVHPTVMNRAIKVTVELLSPAGRPVQRTTDLPGFWRGSYSQVRSELRGRYPKHPWPEDPWNLPTRK